MPFARGKVERGDGQAECRRGRLGSAIANCALALTRLLGAELKETLDANAIEDAAVILWSSLGAEGFQRPEITIEVVLEDGTRAAVHVRSDVCQSAAASAQCAGGAIQGQARGAILHRLVEFKGLTVMRPKDARAVFSLGHDDVRQRADECLFAFARVPARPTRC